MWLERRFAGLLPRGLARYGVGPDKDRSLLQALGWGVVYRDEEVIGVFAEGESAGYRWVM